MIDLTIPIKTVSEANCSEHWTKKDKRHQQQQFFVRAAFNQIREPITLPCTITLIRMSPRKLDEHDNLRMSMKWIADQVAECLIPGKKKGLADSDIRITWKYAQEKSSISAVRIQISCETRQAHVGIDHECNPQLS